MSINTARKAGITGATIQIDEFIPSKETMKVVRKMENSRTRFSEVDLIADSGGEIISFKTSTLEWEIYSDGNGTFSAHIVHGESYERKTAHGIVDIVSRVENGK